MFSRVRLLSLAIAAVVAAPLSAEDAPRKKAPKVVFVTGDEEYRSEESMPMLAKMLHDQHGFDVTICYALDAEGTIKPDRLDHIAGLEALKEADLMVMFTRYRALPDAELKMILDYVASGRPAIGFRTATHAFKYPSGPNTKYNDGFALDLWGAKWVTHHGHEKGEFLTDVRPNAEAAVPAILKGVGEFKVPSWLYHVDGGNEKLPADCNVLLYGTSLVSSHERAKKLDQFPLRQPVAWTRVLKKDGKDQRVFFTTLGHPYDFKQEPFRKLVVNAVFWCLGREGEIPESGLKADPGDYNPTNAAFGGHVKGRKPQ